MRRGRTMTLPIYRPRFSPLAELAMAAALGTAIALLLGSIVDRAKAEPCPSGTQSCKVLTLTPDEEQALTGARGILDTAKQGRPLDLGGAVEYFRTKIDKAPAGTILPQTPVQTVPIPAPRPPEADKPGEAKP